MRVLVALLVYLVCAFAYLAVIINWIAKGSIDHRYANLVAYMVNMLLWPYALFMWLLYKLLKIFRPDEPEEKEESNDDTSRS